VYRRLTVDRPFLWARNYLTAENTLDTEGENRELNTGFDIIQKSHAGYWVLSGIIFK
jgi:hypothetical protein